MKKFFKRAQVFAPLLITAVIMLMPLFAAAEATSAFAQCNGSSCQIKNPLAASNFCTLIKIILQAILMIGMPIAVVFLVIVGFKFIVAQGKPEGIEKAKEDLLHTVIGIAIFLGAWAIAKIIASTLAGLGVSAVNECVR